MKNRVKNFECRKICHNCENCYLWDGSIGVYYLCLFGCSPSKRKVRDRRIRLNMFLDNHTNDFIFRREISDPFVVDCFHWVPDKIRSNFEKFQFCLGIINNNSYTKNEQEEAKRFIENFICYKKGEK